MQDPLCIFHVPLHNVPVVKKDALVKSSKNLPGRAHTVHTVHTVQSVHCALCTLCILCALCRVCTVHIAHCATAWEGLGGDFRHAHDRIILSNTIIIVNFLFIIFIIFIIFGKPDGHQRLFNHFVKHNCHHIVSIFC